MTSDRIAHTVLEAAYSHLLVFTEPVAAWPADLAARIPAFDDLYVEPPGPVGRPGVAGELEQLLRFGAGPVKLLLTGQKGSGKSWALQRLARQLAETFNVIPVSATDRSGATMADVEVADLMVLLCEALAHHVHADWKADSEVTDALARWKDQLIRLAAIAKVPDSTESFGVDLSFGFAKFAGRMRADLDTRRLVRQAGADELVLVANGFLRAISAVGPAPLVLFDDLDKINPDGAMRLYTDQFSVVARLHTKMVLTFPFSLNFANVLTQRKWVLKNVHVRKSAEAETVDPTALAHFAAVLGRLVDPTLVDGRAVEVAVAGSGGITREFGRILARAFEIAALGGDGRVEEPHAREASRELRVDLERASSDAARRQSLARVRVQKRLDTDLDKRLLNENMVVEYVNGHPWYDVHPLLAEVVDTWPRSE